MAAFSILTLLLAVFSSALGNPAPPPPPPTTSTTTSTTPAPNGPPAPSGLLSCLTDAQKQTICNSCPTPPLCAVKGDADAACTNVSGVVNGTNPQCAAVGVCSFVVSPAPGGSNTVPAPGGAPAPGPGGAPAPAPGPGGAPAPAPGPGGAPAPAPGPGGAPAPAPGPGGAPASAPGPGGAPAPAPGPAPPGGQLPTTSTTTQCPTTSTTTSSTTTVSTTTPSPVQSKSSIVYIALDNVPDGFTKVESCKSSKLLFVYPAGGDITTTTTPKSTY